MKTFLKLKPSFWVLCALILALLFLFFHFDNRIHKLQKKRGKSCKHVMLDGIALPPELYNIPLADQSGIITQITPVFIRNALAAYNPSLINFNSGYLMFFRYDVIDQESPDGLYTYIGCAELDANFQQTDREFVTLDTGNKHSQDPRVLQVGSDILLFYNQYSSESLNSRNMQVAKFNPTNFSLDFHSTLNFQFQSFEKNWVPFEYASPQQPPTCYFEYSLSPHKILKMVDAKTGEIQHQFFPEPSCEQKFLWESRWGILHGGTPAKKIGNEYLSFFQSSFYDEDGFKWYVMGAYTFQDAPPFKIMKSSAYPILFKGIYDTPPINTSNPILRCIFPSGYVTGNLNGKEVLYVSCGENDCGIKIITMDKEKVLSSLQPNYNRN